jgi:CII-binding regulator of phage lambda lysogenization HflD
MQHDEQQLQPPGIVGLQVAVAEMKGMLHQALSDQGQRITKLEADMTVVHGRLGDKGKLLATHTERIQSNHDRIENLEDQQQGAVSRNTAITAVILAALGFIVSVASKIPWGNIAP